MSLKEIEDQTAENAHRVLTLIEGGRRTELQQVMGDFDREELCWLVLALADGLLRQEAANDDLHVKRAILHRQNEVLENANAQLFKDKRELLDRNAELRDIVYHRKDAA